MNYPSYDITVKTSQLFSLIKFNLNPIRSPEIKIQCQSEFSGTKLAGFVGKG